jgi:DNA-3-methyladenine glycosylase
MNRLGRPFFERDALEVAPDLIGCVLVHGSPEGTASVRLVETEAYRGPHDPGSHGYRGMTPRTEVMFGPPGRLYVYLSYGVHWCANIVTGRDGHCQAVLLRAGEPLEGLELMRARRGHLPDRLLASGPGRLAQALGLNKRHNGATLLRGGAIFVVRDEHTDRVQEMDIACTTRIGLATGKGDLLDQRFVLAGSAYASRRV